MKRKNKDKIVEVIIIFLIIVFIAAGMVGIIRKKFSNSNEPITVVKDNVENYIAYIKINPSIKIEYSRKCTLFNDGSEICNDPIVNNYELLNNNAKEIFKDVNLLQNSSNLNDVINIIFKKAEDNGINVQKAVIQSDWNKLNDYFKKNNNKYSISIKIKNKSIILNIIKNDIDLEIKGKTNN